MAELVHTITQPPSLSGASESPTASLIGHCWLLLKDEGNHVSLMTLRVF